MVDASALDFSFLSHITLSPNLSDELVNAAMASWVSFTFYLFQA